LSLLKKPGGTTLHIPRIFLDVLQQGEQKKETEKNMQEAIQMHVEGLIEDGVSLPKSHSSTTYIVV